MKSIHITALCMFVIVFLFSCASSPEREPQPKEEEKGAEQEEAKTTMDIPDFYLNPPVADDVLYGVGSAKMSSVDMSRKMAIARARDDIAFQINATIKAAVTDYAQEAGADDSEKQIIEFVETVSRQIANTTLTGTKTVELYPADDKTIYALVAYPIADLADDVTKEFQRNEDAAFAEFKAEEALKKLNAELQNNPPKAGNLKD